MRTLPLLRPLAMVALHAAAPASAQMHGDPSVHTVIDAFHAAASVADLEAYMGLVAEGAVFLGTDATERWTRDELAAYAAARFENGRGWTYVPSERWVSVAADGATAWFDERLDNENYGETRGSGVLVRESGEWRIAQYNLTIPIPNALAREVVARIREGGAGG